MEDVVGFISKAVKVEGDDDKYLVTVHPAAFEVLSLPGDSSDVYTMAIAASLFKHVFASSFSLKSVNPEDFYIQVQIPKNQFAKEVQLVVESGRGIDFNLSPVETLVGDEVTKYVPRVVIKEEEGDERDK